MTNGYPDRQRGRLQRASAIPHLSLPQVCARTGLSPRWVRELVKRHGLNIRRVPCPGRYRFVFSPADVEQIQQIHQANQRRLKRLYPAFHAVVGKQNGVPPLRSPWSMV